MELAFTKSNEVNWYRFSVLLKKDIISIPERSVLSTLSELKLFPWIECLVNDVPVYSSEFLLHILSSKKGLEFTPQIESLLNPTIRTPRNLVNDIRTELFIAQMFFTKSFISCWKFAYDVSLYCNWFRGGFNEDSYLFGRRAISARFLWNNNR